MSAEPLSYDEILTRKLPHPIHNEQEADRVRDEIQALVRTFPRSEGEEEYLYR